MILELATKERVVVNEYINIFIETPSTTSTRIFQQITFMIVPDLAFDVLICAESCLTTGLLAQWAHKYDIKKTKIVSNARYRLEIANLHEKNNEQPNTHIAHISPASSKHTRSSTEHIPTRKPRYAPPPRRKPIHHTPNIHTNTASRSKPQQRIPVILTVNLPRRRKF
jgi:hypothetical protein